MAVIVSAAVAVAAAGGCSTRTGANEVLPHIAEES